MNWADASELLSQGGKMRLKGWDGYIRANAVTGEVGFYKPDGHGGYWLDGWTPYIQDFFSDEWEEIE